MNGVFAGIALAARVERAESGMVGDCATSIVATGRAEGAFVRPLAGGVAAFTGAGSPFNKVSGLGFAGEVDDAALDALEADYARVGAPVQVELSTLADPTLAARLTRRGYALVSFEHVLGRALPGDTSPGASADVTVAPCGPDDFATWMDVVVDGFAHPDEQGVASHESFPRELLEGVFRDMAAAPGFERTLARRDGVPAGGASMRLASGVALLCGAATLPAHRRRGVQGALLDARLARASAAGCDLAVVTTQPGSKSQQNVERKGFRLLYARAVLVREA